MERVKLTGLESVAREVSGFDSGTAKHFNMNGESADELLAVDEKIKHNQMVEEYVNKFDEHAKGLENYSKCINDKLEGMEIMPILNNILVKPFKENPFQKITVSKSGLITDTGGAAIQFKNTDSGNIEEEESFIHVALVVEAGKECKYTKQGDVIMYTRVSEVPVPFFKQGLALVNETRVMTIINEKLNERFNG